MTSLPRVHVGRFGMKIVTSLIIPICAILAMLIQSKIDTSYWHAVAVKHGVAHYDTATGEWMWNNEESK